MNYSPDEFIALSAEIDRQGGALLSEICKPQDIHFVVPPYNRDHVEKGVTCGCHHEARFVSPYDPEPRSEAKQGFITACAVCDSMGSWPRYEEAVFE